MGDSNQKNTDTVESCVRFSFTIVDTIEKRDPYLMLRRGFFKSRMNNLIRFTLKCLITLEMN
jgi:hypothetical protein